MLSSIARIWRELRDIIILGCNFCLLFSAYSTLQVRDALRRLANPRQSYQTSVNGKSGFYSLAVLYVVFGVSALLAPAFVRAYPLKYRTVVLFAASLLFQARPHHIGLYICLIYWHQRLGCVVSWT